MTNLSLSAGHKPKSLAPVVSVAAKVVINA
jgi:hypothetical protein